jgi:hypothetical protein
LLDHPCFALACWLVEVPALIGFISTAVAVGMRASCLYAAVMQVCWCACSAVVPHS